MKQLQNNFTTPEQSKKLLELGVPADSADCYRTNTYEKRIRQYAPETSSNFFINHPHQIPCWSVGRLIEIYEECVGLYYKHSRDDEQNDNLAESIIYKFENAIDNGNNYPDLYPIINFSKLND